MSLTHTRPHTSGKADVFTEEVPRSGSSVAYPPPLPSCFLSLNKPPFTSSSKIHISSCLLNLMSSPHLCLMHSANNFIFRFISLCFYKQTLMCKEKKKSIQVCNRLQVLKHWTFKYDTESVFHFHHLHTIQFCHAQKGEHFPNLLFPIKVLIISVSPDAFPDPPSLVRSSLLCWESLHTFRTFSLNFTHKSPYLHLLPWVDSPFEIPEPLV